MDTLTRAPDMPVYADYVLDALNEWRREGLKTALLTLVEIDGVSPRPLGSQMAVAEDGRAVGAISGGCAERSLVLDAQAVMARGADHLERYGKGSRYKDLVFPCGSGIGVFFDVNLDDVTLDALCEAHDIRQPCVYRAGDYIRRYAPQTRVVIAGSGHVVAPLAHLAALAEFEVIVISPDAATRETAQPFARIETLKTAGDFVGFQLDAATAFVCLFHDHDREPDLLAVALESPAFYVGALGSHATHDRRRRDLIARGWDDRDLDRIHGPIGLAIGAKTPPEIAIAIVAEIVQSLRAGVGCRMDVVESPTTHTECAATPETTS